MLRHCRLALFFVSLLLCAARVAADTPTITVLEVTYHLAWVEVDPNNGTVTNEYVPPGETTDHWTSLIGVRYWPKASGVKEALGAWTKMIHPALVQKVQIYHSSATINPDDVIAEALLVPRDHSYIEANLFRFVQAPGDQGVHSYQYAERIPLTAGKGDMNHFIQHRSELMDALSSLNPPLHYQPLKAE